MSIDPIRNFAKVDVDGTYNASATAITLATGGVSKLPDPATDGEFNLVWFNATDYNSPSDDPNTEIVRVTGITGDVLTVVRAQEGTTATTKNTGTNYLMLLGVTRKTMEDIEGQLMTGENIGSATSAGSLDGTEEVPINVGGSRQKTTTQDIAELSKLPFVELNNLGSTQSIDFNTGENFEGTLDNNVTITITNLGNGQFGVITLYHDTTAQRTITWAGIDDWADGVEPIAPDTGQKLVVSVFKDNTGVFAVGRLFSSA